MALAVRCLAQAGCDDSWGCSGMVVSCDFLSVSDGPVCFEEDVCLVLDDPGFSFGVAVAAVVEELEEVSMAGCVNVPVVIDLHLIVGGCRSAQPL